MARWPSFSPIEFGNVSADGSADNVSVGGDNVTEHGCKILCCGCTVFDPTDFDQLLDWSRMYFRGSESLIIQTFKRCLPVRVEKTLRNGDVDTVLKYVNVPYIRVHYYGKDDFTGAEKVCTHLFYIYCDCVHHLSSGDLLNRMSVPFGYKIMGNIDDYFDEKL